MVMIYEKRMSLAFAHTLSIFGDVMVQTVQLYQYSGLEENEAEYGSYEEWKIFVLYPFKLSMNKHMYIRLLREYQTIICVFKFTILRI